MTERDTDVVVGKGGIWLMFMFKTPKEYDLVECSDVVVGPVVCLMYWCQKACQDRGSKLRHS